MSHPSRTSSTPTIALVGCVKTKAPWAAPARDLYTSPLFMARRRWVEERSDRWFVLSALHGLVDPDARLEPYDVTLKTMTPAARRAWSRSVLSDLRDAVGDLAGVRVRVLAGAEYRDFGLLDGLRDAGAEVEVVAEGLRVGEQVSFLQGDAETRSTGRRGTPPTRGVAVTSKYAPLADLLASAPSIAFRTTFADIERALGFPLPASARRHRPWWGNSRGNAQARAWLDAGWVVDAVNLTAETVAFRREPRG